LYKENVRNLYVTCGYVKQLRNTWAVGRIYIPYVKNLGGQVRKSASQKDVNVVDLRKYE